jgi:hypothetical protein
LVRVTFTPPPTDTSPPTSTIALDPSIPDGENGWYVSSVRATVTAADEQGGTGVSETRCTLDPTSIPASFGDLPAGCPFTGVGSEIDSDGQHALYAASRDSAGNDETLVSHALKIDRTAPAVTCDQPATSFRLNEAGGSVAATVSDTTSGPTANTVSAAVDTTDVGARTATVTGEDAAGNQTATACPYAVTYAFGGFFTPVDNLDANGDPILNVVKAGRTIPLKWRLTDATGAPVTNLTSAEISVVGIPCTADAALDQLEELAATGSGLQHLGDGNYQLNWKSPTGYANSCKRLRLDLAEGSTRTPTHHTADFKFTK